MEMLMNSIHQFFREKSAEKPKIIAIIGPTASGKTDLAVEIATRYDGEVVNADSRQMYRFLDIGTAKPRPSEMKGIPHHLMSFLDPSRNFSVAEWKETAMKCIDDISRRNRVPVLCGGTGLYVTALIRNYSIPQLAPQDEFREEMEKHATTELYDELMERDPDEAKKIGQGNRRYLIRALEISRFLGEKKSIAAQKGNEPYDPFIIGITMEREDLYRRIDKRVEEMREEGFLDEIRDLMNNGYGITNPGVIAHGYREAMLFLQGKMTENELWETMKKNTRNYAKRQLTWWKRDPQVHWFHAVSKKPIRVRDPGF